MENCQSQNLPTDFAEEPYFLSKGIDELSIYLPFTSKDLDLVGNRELLERLHNRLKGKLSRSEPRSPVLGRLVISSQSGNDLIIEVLHSVKGLDFKELEHTIDLEADKVFGRVLMPHLILKAKIENSVSIDQKDRNDIKHVEMMILSLRAFVADLANQIITEELSSRTLVNFLGEIWEIISGRQATVATEMWNFDFSKIWPLLELKSTKDENILRWIQHRLS